MKGAYTPWAMPQDLIIHAKAAGATGGSFAAGNGASITIAYGDYSDPGVGNDAFSDIHHETGHWIQNNLGRPPGAVQAHSRTTETNEGMAMREGWAEFVAWFTGRVHFCL
jgi:hypothetical protein